MYKILLFLFLFAFTVFSCVYSGNSHDFSSFGSNNGGKRYCMYCHKSVSSYEVKPVWGEFLKDGYKYVSPDIDMKTYKKVVKIVEKVTTVCLSCHTDFANHDENIHPVSVNIYNSDSEEVSVSKSDGKINGDLPLFGNGDMLECATCHDPHTKEVNLLRVASGELCKDCHTK